MKIRDTIKQLKSVKRVKFEIKENEVLLIELKGSGLNRLAVENFKKIFYAAVPEIPKEKVLILGLPPEGDISMKIIDIKEANVHSNTLGVIAEQN